MTLLYCGILSLLLSCPLCPVLMWWHVPGVIVAYYALSVDIQSGGLLYSGGRIRESLGQTGGCWYAIDERRIKRVKSEKFQYNKQFLLLLVYNCTTYSE